MSNYIPDPTDYFDMKDAEEAAAMKKARAAGKICSNCGRVIHDAGYMPEKTLICETCMEEYLDNLKESVIVWVD